MKIIKDIKKKLLNKKEELDKSINEMKIESLQKRDESRRKKLLAAEVGTLNYGLLHRKNVVDFTRDAINRRKLKRLEKKEIDDD